ncbi:hypothetical protein D8B26_001795 [Coccidioides posadasii str. Silveira]|uniref:PAP2 domain-containing protein n=1 Tax=Coccidioides posadasii (strain RMSCC 757 / Silveira) TaxID=443226 RepID=E9CWF7_COCPS|nr:PAP2 domain-containing protein [Coccidioides posadasii str. Silveira]QVM07092.1 hypothetical protein D8B26_001795 [Coccidioides posadasii str. Silveira]
MAQNDLPLHGNRKPSGISAKPGCLGAVARFWYRSYAADYISLAIITAGWFIIQIFVEPFHRMFSLENGSIQFPFAVVERVPVVWAVIYAGILPLMIIGIWAAVTRSGSHFTHVTILGFLATLILTSFLTDVVKNAVGRPRPDLISRCKPEKGTPAHTLVSFNVCLETDHHILHEGWRSFPSGHSSFAFGGLGYLSLFFAGQLHVFRPRSGLARFLFSAAPLLGALMIAMSRLADYRHDVYDVTVGSLLGLFTAYFTYRRYYPSLKSIDCDTPYSRPSGGYVAVSGVNRGLGDEEQPCNSPRPEYSGAEYQMQ